MQSPNKKPKRKFIVPTRSPTKDTQLVGPLVIEYSTSYDILSVDAMVKAKLDAETNDLPMLREEIEIIDIEISRARIISTRRTLEQQRLNIMDRVNNITQSISKKKYILDTKSILESFLLLDASESNRSDTPIDAMNVSNNMQSENERSIEKLVDSYLAVAVKYIDIIIDKTVVSHTNNICMFCGQSLVGGKTLSTGTILCPNESCGGENKYMSSIQLPPKEYDTWKNLYKAHCRHMGKAQIKFNIDIMMKDLDDYFTLVCDPPKPPGEYYRSLPLDTDGKKAGTSHYILCDALKVIGYQQFYKDYMYVCNVYYGWKLPELSKLEPVMESNFRLKQDEWDNMTVEERGGKSALATGYRLCREYQHAGFNCTLDDFRVSSRRATLDRYDKAYKMMCVRAGFKFPHILQNTIQSGVDN